MPPRPSPTGARTKAPGKGRIELRTARDGDERVRIEVLDDGPGIPDAIQDRIFDPFFTTKEVGRGSGQGLAVAHNVLVVKHAGRIDVESAPAAGTTVTIRLPLSQPRGEG